MERWGDTVEIDGAQGAPVLLGQVADDVERPVEVLQRDHLAAHLGRYMGDIGEMQLS